MNEYSKLLIRLPDSLITLIQAAASKQRRTVTAQINYMLEAQINLIFPKILFPDKQPGGDVDNKVRTTADYHHGKLRPGDEGYDDT